MEQRNALLKERWCTREMLAAWNDSLAQAGASLLTHRLALLDRIRVRFVEAYAQIAPGERADIAYEASVDAVLGATAGDAVAADAGGPVAAGEDVAADDRSADGTAANRAGVDRTTQVAWWRERMLAAFDAVFNDELRRGITLVGPHRDEIRFSIDGRDARAFASQGQQRSLVLAWKVAEVAVTRDILGRPPLLLLDDVMSELDAERREAFVRGIEDEVQTVITTTNLGYFSDAILDRAKVVTIGTV